MRRCTNCEEPATGRCATCTSTELGEIVFRYAADLFTDPRLRQMQEVQGILAELCSLDLTLPAVEDDDAIRAG